MNQELVQALDELVAARKMAPSRRHSLIVAAQQIVGRFGRTPFSIGRSRQAVGNVIAELLEHVCPLIQAGAQPVSRPASPAVNGVAPCSDGASCALPPCLGEQFFWQSAVISTVSREPLEGGGGSRRWYTQVHEPSRRAKNTQFYRCLLT